MLFHDIIACHWLFKSFSYPLSSSFPHIDRSLYMHCKLTLLYIIFFYLMLTSLMWFASSSMSPYIQWMYFCLGRKKKEREDRKGKFVFFSCHTIYSSITFMDVHAQKKSFSSHFHLPFRPLLHIHTIHSLCCRYNPSHSMYMCTFPIFYCHRFMLCSVSLFTNTIWQIFF